MKKSPTLLSVLLILSALFSIFYGASVASAELCPIQEGRAVCTLDQKTYDNKRECLRNCVSDQTGETPVASPPDQPEPGSCIDADGDLHGENCDAGSDCNDSESSLTDDCNVCGNGVAEASNNEECDEGDDNGKWIGDVSRTCSDGSKVDGQSRCTENCRFERTFQSCPDGTQGSTATRPQPIECNIVDGKAICESGNPRREFSSRRACLRECVSGEVEGTTGSEGNEPEKADLIVEIIRAPDEVITGNGYRIIARVRNAGRNGTLESSRSGSPFRVILQLVDAGNSRTRFFLGERLVARLDPGRRSDLTFVWNDVPELTGRRYRFEAVVDTQDKIDESDEGNNVHSIPVTVREREPGNSVTTESLCVEESGRAICTTGNPKSDFGSDSRECLRRCRPEPLAEGIDLIVDVILPDKAVIYESYNLTVRVTNIGSQRAYRDFRTFVVHKSPAWQNPRYANETVIRGLGPDKTVEIKFPRYSTTPSILEYTAHVDADNYIDEANEENNNDTARMQIVTLAADLVTTNAVPVPSENNEFRVSTTIKNQGNVRLSRHAEVRAVINSSGESIPRTLCAGASIMRSALQPGKSGRSVTYLRKTANGRDCLLGKGKYTLVVTVGEDKYTKDFSFGADPETSALVCPALDDVSPYGFAAKPVGFRSVPDLYCDLTGVLSQQKNIRSPCDNSFECKSNLCAAGVCVNEARLNEALAAIS